MSHHHVSHVTRVVRKPVVSHGLRVSHHHHAPAHTSVTASGVSNSELATLKARYEKEERRLKLEIDELTEANLSLEN